MFKKKVSIMVSILVVVFLLTTAAYAAYQSYSVVLPALQGHTTLMTGNKATNDDYILHRNIVLGAGYDSAWVWVDKQSGSDWIQVSDGQLHYEGGGPYTLYFNSSLNSGDFIRVRAKNGTFSTVSVTMSGELDLK